MPVKKINQDNLCRAGRLEKAFFLAIRIRCLIKEICCWSWQIINGPKLICLKIPDHKSRKHRHMRLVLKWQFFVILFFFLMLFIVIGFKLSIVLRDKDKQVIAVFLRMKFCMLYKFTKINKVTNTNVKTLYQNQERSCYGNKFYHHNP